MNIILVFLLSAAGVVGDYFLKLASYQEREFHNKWFVIGVFAFALTAFGWVIAMKHIKLSSIGVYYSLFTVLLLVLVGVVFFKEKLSTAEIAGTVMAIFSVMLLSRFSD